MSNKTPFRVELDLGAILSPMELESYKAKAAEMGRNLKEHTIALLFGPQRIPTQPGDENKPAA